MPTKRNENYITDKVLVPFYNKSEEFRRFLSQKFGKNIYFGDRLKATCDERNKTLGNPDAETTDKKLFIEVKINNNAKLTQNEQQGGAYENRLCKNQDHYLLYIINDDFDMKNAVKKPKERIRKIFWTEIYNFIEKYDNTAPELKILVGSVAGLAEKIPMDTATAQKEFLKFINNFNIKLMQEDAEYSPLEIANMGVYEEYGFWFTLKKSEYFLGFDFETGSVDLISISISLKKFKNKKKDLNKINKFGEYENDGIYYLGICKTSEFLKNESEEKEEKNIRIFKNKIEEILNVLKK